MTSKSKRIVAALLSLTVLGAPTIGFDNIQMQNGFHVAAAGNISITKQPQNITVSKAGDYATMTIDAVGEGLSYAWYYKNPGMENFEKSTTTTKNYGLTITSARDGRQMYCVVSDSNGNSVQSDIATFTIEKVNAMSIVSQPTDFTGKIGDNFTFKVVAEGTGLKYQWQWRQNENCSWSNTGASGNKTDTLSDTITASRLGVQYRCIITDANGNTVTSETATLKESGISIIKQPQNTMVSKAGDYATMTIDAAGEGLKYTWYYKNPGMENFEKSTTTTKNYGLTITSARDGRQMYCVVSDFNGNSVQSDIATFTIEKTNMLSITSQPTDFTGKLGDRFSFKVVAEGNGLKYQWQWRQNENFNWANTSAGGNQTDTLSDIITASRIGVQYRCIIIDSSGNKMESDAATLVENTLKITSNPSNFTGKIGDSFTFKVVAEGTGLKYQWQWRQNENSNWANTSAGGNQTDTLSDKITSSRIGVQYRCVITDSSGNSLTSDTVSLIKFNPLTLSDLPSTTVIEGNDVTFSITAEGSGNLTYQWQEAVAPLNEVTPIDWIDVPNATTSSYTFKAKYSDNGKVYRCIVSNGTETVNSSVATLTVEEADAVISNITKEITINAGEAYQLDLTGKGLRYYSNTNDVTVDKNGVVTANEPCTAFIFVLDNYGHKTFYKIHAVEAFEALTFDEDVVNLKPNETYRLYTNKEAYQMVSDEAKTSPYWDNYWNHNIHGEYSEFTGYVPGTYTVMAYTEDGEIATCEINVEGEVIDAALNTPYTGTITVDSESISEYEYEEYSEGLSNKWYRYVNDSDSTVLVTFDVNTIEDDDNEDRILNASYSVYYKDYFNKPIWCNTGDIVNEQIYLAPGEEVYVRPYVNDMMTSVYDFTINATPYNSVDYTIGTTISNVTLDRKDYTNYVFTPSVSGEYKLTASSETSFYWQVNDTEHNSEPVAWDWVDNATLKTFDLQKGHQYTISFIPQNKEYEDTLEFKIVKAENVIVNAAVDTTYSNYSIENGKTVYYKFDLVAHEGNVNMDAFNFSYSGDLSYQLLDSDMSKEYDCEKVSSGYRFNIDDDSTVYVKVTNNSGETKKTNFRVDEYNHYYRNITLNGTLNSNWMEMSAYTAIDTLGVACYTFTIPAKGTYNISIGTIEDDVIFCDNNGLISKNLILLQEYNEGDKVYAYVYNNKKSEYEYKLYANWTEYDDVSNLELDTPVEGATENGKNAYFKFTAPKTGTYYFWSQANAQMIGELTSKPGGELLTREENNGAYGNFCITYRLKAGQTVYLCPRQAQDRDVEYQVVVSRTNNSRKWRPTYNHTAMTLNEEYDGNYYDDYEFSSFSFTAEEAGTYVFTSDSEYDMYGDLYSDTSLRTWIAGDSYGNGNQFKIECELEAGQTVYLKPTYWNGNANYSVKVTEKAIDDIIPDEVCDECGGVNGQHEETCSHYGENVEDGDED